MLSWGDRLKPVYGVQFQIRPEAPATSGSLLESVRGDVVDWVKQWYQQWKSIEVPVPADGGRAAPSSDHLIQTTLQKAGTGEAVWQLSWRFPDNRDQSLFWETNCLVAVADGKAEFSLLLRVGSLEFEVKPAEYWLGRPKIVRTVVEKYSCILGERRLLTKPMLLGAEDVHSYVQDVLASPGRRMPIVVVSPQESTTGYLISADQVADLVVGLAEVAVLKDKWAAYSLRDEVSRIWSCYNGATRIYWPGFRTARDPMFHPIYLPEDLVRMGRSRKGAENSVFYRLASISVVRIIEGPVTKRAMDA